MVALLNVGDVVTPKSNDPRLFEYSGKEFTIVHVYYDGPDEEELDDTLWLVDLSPEFPGFRANKCGWFASRFLVVTPAAKKDPVLERINKLYKKCKSTQHWRINDTI